MINLAEKIEDFIKQHNDSKFLDLTEFTELDISLDIMNGIVSILENGLFKDIQQTNSCGTCLHFKGFGNKWEDACEKDWDCIHYYNKPNRWEAIK